MNKELEALENLLSFAFVMSENMVGLTKGNYDEKIFVKKTYEYLNKYIGNFECRDILKSALQRLESIDNSNPSEALECLEELNHKGIDNNGLTLIRTSIFKEDISSIKQSLLKAQEQEKVLEIIEEKKVDIGLLKRSESWLVYYTGIKHRTGINTELTEEEFELLKQYFGKNIQK